jgi:catechol 2,3-dioxygenase-like lactoylglutathione lyase family enzyme
MSAPLGVSELRLVVTVDDYDTAVAFYRDALGLAEAAEYISDGEGRVIILEAGRATLELTDRQHAEHIDAIEVGSRVAGQFRVAFQVADSTDATRVLAKRGANVLAQPTRTPWNSLNSRLDAPGGMQLTLFEDLTV